jgi:hypothetical protein
MPTFVPKLRRRFKLHIQDGLPQAIVESIDGTQWLSCCPLCGCTHQIIGADEKQPYTPLCQILPLLYKAQQEIWQKLHPNVNQYTTLHLIVR